MCSAKTKQCDFIPAGVLVVCVKPFQNVMVCLAFRSRKSPKVLDINITTIEDESCLKYSCLKHNFSYVSIHDLFPARSFLK